MGNKNSTEISFHYDPSSPQSRQKRKGASTKFFRVSLTNEDRAAYRPKVAPQRVEVSIEVMLESMEYDLAKLNALMRENRITTLKEENLEKENAQIEILKKRRKECRDKIKGWREILIEKQEFNKEINEMKEEKDNLKGEIEKLESTVKTLKDVYHDMKQMKQEFESYQAEELKLNRLIYD